MWKGCRLAVVLPTYNEADSIVDCIRSFESLGIVDDIVVVNNNAHPDTSPRVATTVAREVFESRQGYGAAIKRGLDETSTADLVAICEPDGTFDPEDIFKLLPFLSDSDAVIGSRTVQIFIYNGANMDAALRWGNYGVAKVIELLFNTTYLSDVGCTFRVMKRSTIDTIRPALLEDGSAAGLEMMLRLVQLRAATVQVPVRYKERVGESSVTGDRKTAIRLGLIMVKMVFRERLRPTWKRL